MPILTTYPGVYIEELSSGQHMVTPLSTSIAAFVGRAPMGAVNEPLTILIGGAEGPDPASVRVALHLNPGMWSGWRCCRHLNPGKTLKLKKSQSGI
jgi:hypothetical protein